MRDAKNYIKPRTSLRPQQHVEMVRQIVAEQTGVGHKLVTYVGALPHESLAAGHLQHCECATLAFRVPFLLKHTFDVRDHKGKARAVMQGKCKACGRIYVGEVSREWRG